VTPWAFLKSSIVQYHKVLKKRGSARETDGTSTKQQAVSCITVFIMADSSRIDDPMTLEMVTTAAAAAESSSSWKMQNDDEEEDAREVFEDETSHSISLRSNITKEENYLLLATDGDDEEERGSSSFTWTKQPDFCSSRRRLAFVVAVLIFSLALIATIVPSIVGSKQQQQQQQQQDNAALNDLSQEQHEYYPAEQSSTASTTIPTSSTAATVAATTSTTTPSPSTTIAATLTTSTTTTDSTLPETTTTSATTTGTTSATSPATTTTIPPPQSDKSSVTYYTIARTDRSGAAIKEMILAHAHCFVNNVTYGGACIDEIDWKKAAKGGDVHRTKKKFRERLVVRKQMIAALGLTHELPIACPSAQDVKEGRAVIYKKRSQFTKTLFPADWKHHLQQVTTFPYKAENQAGEVPAYLQVVVHLRRGDFTPCHVSDRYMPNIYYLEVLDEYLPKVCRPMIHDDTAEDTTSTTPYPSSRPLLPICNVTIYTEQKSFEPFTPFYERNYTIDFDSPLEDIWAAFINADMFVMSRSSFSFCPALLSRHTVIAPYVNIDHWTTVSYFIWSDFNQVLATQVAQCPPKL
jgi:type II secretory pathway pseudopilin PulG